ncbi:MAG: chemotaxis protein CheW [Planctomycetota bacterium]|jgi:purine-binding chemotaxis protein CheW
MSDKPGFPNASAPASDQGATSQFVGFQIAEQEYAFRIEQIQEILILDRVTRVPQVVDCCEGVSNLRGSIIPIINLRVLFGLEPKPADAETRTIVVNVGERTMGCTVDSVSQVLRIPNEDIQPAPEALIAEGADYLVGFAKLGGRFVSLLDVDRLLDPQKLDRVRQLALDAEPQDSQAGR